MRSRCSIICIYIYSVYMYIYIYAHPPPPNGPTADGSRVLARSRQKTTKQETNKNQQTKNIQKTKKTKKTKKTIFSKTMGLGPPKDCFFGFLEKKMVSNRKKTIFFSRKQKKPSFGGPSPIVLEKMVFLVFLVFLGFLEKKMVFWFETIFFSRKRLF